MVDLMAGWWAFNVGSQTVDLIIFDDHEGIINIAPPEAKRLG